MIFVAIYPDSERAERVDLKGIPLRRGDPVPGAPDYILDRYVFMPGKPFVAEDGTSIPAGFLRWRKAPEFACPCCQFVTLYRQPPGTYAICRVCGWEDDPLQFSNPDYEEGPNKVSLIRRARTSAATASLTFADRRARGRRSQTSIRSMTRLTGVESERRGASDGGVSGRRRRSSRPTPGATRERGWRLRLERGKTAC